MIDVQTYKLVQGSRDGEEYCVDLSLLYVRIEFDTMYSSIWSYYLILKYVGLQIWLTIVTWEASFHLLNWEVLQQLGRVLIVVNAKQVLKSKELWMLTCSTTYRFFCVLVLYILLKTGKEINWSQNMPTATIPQIYIPDLPTLHLKPFPL